MINIDNSFFDDAERVFAHYDKEGGRILVMQRHGKSKNSALVIPLETWVRINKWVLSEGERSGF